MGTLAQIVASSFGLGEKAMEYMATVFEIFTVKDRKLLILLTCSFFDAP